MTIPASLRNALYLLLLVALSGCGSTTLTDSWQAPGFERQSMKQVLVVGVTANITNRVLFERGFVKELASKGIQATASVDVIGKARPTKASVMAYLQNHAASHVIVTHHDGTHTTAEYVPPSSTTYYTGPFYSGPSYYRGPMYPTFGDYWGRYGNTVTLTQDAYVSTRTSVILTTSIFDVKTENLMWTGRSETYQTSSIAADASILAKKIINNIKN